MKKTATTDPQPGKTEIINAATPTRQNSIQKLYKDYKLFDHAHGRINKHPIGMNHEPGIF